VIRNFQILYAAWIAACFLLCAILSFTLFVFGSDYQFNSTQKFWATFAVLRRGRAINLHCDGGLTEPGTPGDMTGRHDTMQIPLVLPRPCARRALRNAAVVRCAARLLPCLISSSAAVFVFFSSVFSAPPLFLMSLRRSGG
jgi:hypothetical protein